MKPCKCAFCGRMKPHQRIRCTCRAFELNYEPTEEEVEAVVAEQMKRLPKWWDKESGKGSAHPVSVKRSKVKHA